eukprot:TRINITY_DN10843_c0_g1_i2.p1 TRINITY_DN10843_c0_g1~~TRINITY_DN10843_c0_g1_i2.p1  ORF type:complete len:344 (+),score=13.71 TRINITY_DN10843_c0_g1_i2:71-1033(+)
MAISDAISGVYADFNATLALERALLSGLIAYDIALPQIPTISLPQVAQLLALPLDTLASIFNQTGNVFDTIFGALNNLQDQQKATLVFILSNLQNETKAVVSQRLDILTSIAANITGQLAKIDGSLPFRTLPEVANNVTGQILTGLNQVVANISGQVAKLDDSLPVEIVTEVTTNITRELLQAPTLQFINQSITTVNLILGSVQGQSQALVSSIVDDFVNQTQPLIQGVVSSFGQVAANVSGQIAKVEPLLFNEIVEQVVANISGEISRINFYFPVQAVSEVSANITDQIGDLLLFDEISQIIEQQGILGVKCKTGDGFS